jgi:TPP-dependent trihydroxycyclohexane-1,2-dione (THcHDO) dehydratase
MLSLGEAATLNQLKNMAGSLDCQEEDGTYFCRFLDEAEQKQSFKLSFVQENNTYGAKAWKVHIDERNFGID